MKFKHLTLMILAGLFAVACSSDDDPNPAKEVASTYNGYTWASYFSGAYTTLTEDESVAITSNEDGTATVVLTSGSWGTSTISAATVTASTNGYTISGTGISTMTNHNTGATSTNDCTLTGTISADKSTIELVFTLPTSVMQGTTITFKKGDAPDNLVVAGSYSGYVVKDSPMSGTMSPEEGQTISITANEDGTVNVTYGDNTISNVEVEASSGGVYTLTGEGIYAMPNMAGVIGNYDCTFTATISSDKSDVEILFSLPAVMNGMTITFKNGNAPAAMMIAKTYNGALGISVSGTSMGNVDDSSVTVKAQEDGKAEITLSAFTFGSYAFEDIVTEDVDVTVEDDIYTLSGTINITGGDFPIVGSLTGTIEDGVANIVFILTPGAMPMPITATFISE